VLAVAGAGVVRELARRRLLSPRAVATDAAARKAPAAGKSFGLSFQQAMREPTFWILNARILPARRHGDEPRHAASRRCCASAGWTAVETTRLADDVRFRLLFARVAVGFVIDHIFAPRVLTTVSIGGAVACVLYAMYPDLATSARS
jgi:hypothetical protein